jgi:predicted nucleotidyltransferase
MAFAAVDAAQLLRIVTSTNSGDITMNISKTSAFLTGSRVYGTPRPESDADLVIFTDEKTKNDLFALSRLFSRDTSDIGKGSTENSCRFGDLNLIVITDEADWTRWQIGTVACTLQKPVTREHAVAMFKSLGIGAKQS